MEWGLRERERERGEKNFTLEMGRERAANARNPITKCDENDDR